MLKFKKSMKHVKHNEQTYWIKNQIQYNKILVQNGVQYLKKDYNGIKNNAEFESSWNRLDRKFLA